MKSRFFQPFANSRTTLPFRVVVLPTVVISIWFAQFLSDYVTEPFFLANINSASLVWAINFLGIVFVAASSLTILYCYKSQKSFLIKNAQMKRTEEALQHSESRFRDLIENANDLIYTSDLQGNFTSLNKIGERITGYSEAEFCRLNFAAVVAPEHLENTTQRLTGKIPTKPSTIYEENIIAKNGERVLLELNYRIIFHAGKPAGIQGIGRDITARKRAEATLRESEARYRVVTESASDAILTIDGDQTILFVNAAAEKIFGYTIGEMLGSKLFMLVPERFRDAHATGMKVYRETKERRISWQGVEVPGRHKNGSEVPLEITFGEIVNDGKHLFTAVIRDITERKRIKEELENNLSLLSSTFEATNDGILVVDRENRIVTHNQKFVEMAQLPREVIESMDNSKVINYVLDQLSEPQSFLDMTRRLILNPEIQGCDVVKFKSGKTFERYSHPRVLGGEIAGRVISFRDITERERAEDTLRESESLLAAAQRITHLGSWELDLADLKNLLNNEARWSDETYRIFGYEPGQFEVSGEIFYNAVHPDDRERVGRMFIEAIKQKKIYKIEHRVILPDGGERIVLGQAELTFDKRTGKPLKMFGTVQDITERKSVEALIQQSEEKYRSILETIEEGYFETDLEGVFTFYNQALGNVLGYDTDELLGMHYRNYVDHRNAKKLLVAYVKVYRTGQPISELSWEVIRQDGTRRFLESSIKLMHNSAGVAVGFRGIARDVTERQRTEEALRESEVKYRLLIENTSEGLLQVSASDLTLFVNNRFCEMVGYSADELVNRNWTQMLLDDDGRESIRQANERRRRGISDRYEIKLRRKSGELFWVIIGGSPMFDHNGVITGSIGVFSDISERKRAEEQLLHDAFHDGLTALSNRALFMNHLRLTVERCKSRHNSPYAVLFLDFDRFKIVNDSLGHAEGDKLLVQIARRLEAATRTGDLVARLGGDEFVVLLNELVAENEAVLIAERIQSHLKNPFDLSGNKIFITASIGIALSSAGCQSAEDMVRDADIAMYRAKTKGKAQYQVFDRSMHVQASKRLSFETEMHRALEREEFLLHYQPIINLETEKLQGFEALVRWKHPERGMIPPFEFIPAAEENNLILPLGDWILRESCRQMRQWQNDYPETPLLTVSVNLSSKQFLQPDLTEQVTRALDASGLDPGSLKLEITESHVMENTEMAIRTMNNLKILGVELSLDDFGTGYSSLSYLHRLPVSYLKIDRSFVNRMIESAENGEIVSTIVKLGQNLKMKVIAEGIETPDQLCYLKKLTCEYGQGYLFSKPLEPASALTFIGENFKNISYETDRAVINLEQNM